MPNPIVPFYLGEAADSQGRFLRDLRAWNHGRLESVHDYIQWMFPTRQASQFNWHAPTLDDETVRAFRSDGRLRAALLDSLRQMLDFYGFQLREDENGAPVVETAASWDARQREWFHAGDHNLLRITRILDCLNTLGLATYAHAFLRALDAGGDAAPGTIPPRTRKFWRAAVPADADML